MRTTINLDESLVEEALTLTGPKGRTELIHEGLDTSVWVDHLRTATPELAKALDAGLVYTHPFVVGELACGTCSRRSSSERPYASGLATAGSQRSQRSSKCGTRSSEDA